MKWLVFILLVNIPGILYAQGGVSGKITDSSGNPVARATVSVLLESTGAITAYAQSNPQGYFEIRSEIQGKSILRVSCIGYLTREIPLQPSQKNYTVILTRGVYQLPEVKVVRREVIRLKGDTLSYNVKEFTRTQDRTIGDVIKNLPGITVSATGAISYNGKPINKFYIDGDDLLGDKYAIASNTLPANVVDAVQVLENHQPVKMLENIAISDNAALNIKLNNDARLRVFGSGNAGAGLPLPAADARLNLLAFRKKIKMIDVLALNNTGGTLGNEVMSQNTMNIDQLAALNVKQPLTGFTQQMAPPIPYRYYTDNFDKLVSLNHLLPVKNNRLFRIHAYWLPENHTLNTRQQYLFLLPGDTILQYEQQKQQLKRNTFQTGITYTNNGEKAYLQNEFVAECATEKGTSQIQNEIESFNQRLNRDFVRIKNIFSLKRITRKKMIPELRVEINYQNNPEQLFIEKGLYPWLLNNNTPFSNTVQGARQQKYNLAVDLSVSRKFKKILAGIKAIARADQEQYTSGIVLEQLNHEETDAGNVFANNLRWARTQLGAEPTIEYQHKKIRFSLYMPVLLQRFAYRNSYFTGNEQVFQLVANPSAKLLYELGRYSRAAISLRRSTNFTSAPELLAGGIFSDYRNLSQKQQTLQPINDLTLSANFLHRNPVKITFFNAGIIYIKSHSPVIGSSTIRSGIVQTQQVSFNNTTHRLMFLSGASKYFVSLKTTIKTLLNSTLNRFFQLQNNTIHSLNGESHQVNIIVTSRPVWFVNIEANTFYLYSRTKNRQTNKQVSDPIYTWNNSFSATVNLRENIFIQAETSYIVQYISSAKNKFLLTDMKCNWLLKKTKTDLGIKAINIFNTGLFTTTSINGNMVNTLSYSLRPFTIMAYASFRF